MRGGRWGEPSLIRIDASRDTSTALVLFELRKDARLILATYEFDEACRCLAALEVEHPEQLVDASLKWGAVEIREDTNPKWRGG